MKERLPFFLFFLSGFSSLVYEVVWSRMLVLVFGNTTLATSLILGSFMAGLALGSYFWGKHFLYWKRRPLFLFGLLEVSTGIYALLLPMLINGATPIEIWLAGNLSLGFYPHAILRGFLCFVLILPPAFLMGGTFAVISGHLIRNRQKIGRDAALLYGLNTAGAVLGAGLSGFILVRELGHGGSTLLASGINFCVGAAAFCIDRMGDQSVGSFAEKEPVPLGSRQTGSDAVFKVVLIGLGVSGFCGLCYEVLWTRLLLLMVDNSVYSFTVILSVFLSGIAIGSLLLAPFAKRLSNPTLVFGLSQLGIGLIAYFFPFFVQIRSVHGTVQYYAFLCQMIFLMVLLPAILMGMALPLALCIRSAGKESKVAAEIGTLYAVNTLGGVVGSLAAGFFLIPFLGLQKTSLLLPVMNWLVGGTLVWYSLEGLPRKSLSTGIAAILLAGLFLSPQDLLKEKYAALAPGSRMIFYKEGVAATATIMDRPNGERTLFLNGIPQVRNDRTSLKTFKLMGALPCLFHEKPSKGLAITFGAGITSGTMASFVDTLDCVELVAEAPEIAEFFSAENGDVLKNGKVSLHINDARHFLLTSPKRYEVIVADATHPRGYDSWILFTKEFYELLKGRLEPGGIFSQWVPFHGMDLEQYMAIVKTFQSVFPNSSIWIIDHAHSLLFGFTGQEKMDFGRMVQRISGAGEILKPVGLEDPFTLLSHFSMGKGGMEKMLAKFPGIITDDSPRHLFFPLGATFGEQYGQWPKENALYIQQYSESMVPYLSNIGDSEEQRIANLNRLRVKRTKP
ncbi:MAG: hypothetical protein CVU57_13095 [Deltaproteobacteria bacterium HGW-Deltaproteobacteria-15]|nr:MAG: hypothetical protein CVU57_13095 [Deltaproteobacteria bacterium HGW-Deltaproteobacteria-15]